MRGSRPKDNRFSNPLLPNTSPLTNSLQTSASIRVSPLSLSNKKHLGRGTKGPYSERRFLPQRRKNAKRCRASDCFLCVFAPLRSQKKGRGAVFSLSPS